MSDSPVFIDLVDDHPTSLTIYDGETGPPGPQGPVGPPGQWTAVTAAQYAALEASDDVELGKLYLIIPEPGTPAGVTLDVVLASPGGSLWRVRVDDTGTISTQPA